MKRKRHKPGQIIRPTPILRISLMVVKDSVGRQ